MRILQINSSNNYGGGERHFVDLCRGLHDSGDDVMAVVRPGNNWSKRLSFLPADHVKTVALRNSADIFSARKIARLIRGHKAEIVHAHLARDYPLASLALRQSRDAKLVITRHVMFPLKNINRYLLKNVDAVIAVSSAVEKNLSKTFQSEKIVCVPNGVSVQIDGENADSGKSFRFQHTISNDARVVANIGELSELKGQREFVMAAAEVVKACPEAHFVIVGKDRAFDQSYRRDVKRLAKILGIKDKVLFLDWIDDLTELFAATDVFVSSSHSESFGLAILEAMALKKPVVATKTDGAQELITDRHSGLLVDIDDSVSMAEAIVRILSDHDLALSLGDTAHKTALANFTLEEMISKTKRVYSEVLNK